MNFFNPKRNRAIAGIIAVLLAASMVVTALVSLVVYFHMLQIYRNSGIMSNIFVDMHLENDM